MANQRAADQEFIGLWVSNALTKKIDAARDGKARSQWIRDAVAGLLAEEGFNVLKHEKNARDRVKRNRMAYPPLDQKSNLKQPSEDSEILDALEKAPENPPPKSKRKR